MPRNRNRNLSVVAENNSNNSTETGASEMNETQETGVDTLETGSENPQDNNGEHVGQNDESQEASEVSEQEQADAETASGSEEGEKTGTDTAKENVVSVTFRKTHPKRLINSMASINNATLEETDDTYVLSAPYIKISRVDVESTIGKITDAKWRMLFVNRSGEVKEFNNYEFTIGTPKPVIVAEEQRDTVQVNIRISREIKADLEKYRSAEYLDMSQHTFVEEALREFISHIKRELV